MLNNFCLQTSAPEIEASSRSQGMAAKANTDWRTSLHVQVRAASSYCITPASVPGDHQWSCHACNGASFSQASRCLHPDTSIQVHCAVEQATSMSCPSQKVSHSSLHCIASAAGSRDWVAGAILCAFCSQNKVAESDLTKAMYCPVAQGAVAVEGEAHLWRPGRGGPPLPTSAAHMGHYA